MFAGKKNLAYDELKHPVGADDIRIAPIVIGSKRGGVLNVILGAVMIVVGVIAEVYLQEFGGGVWGKYLIEAGIGMIAGGVIQMLSPLPKGISSKDSPGNTPSYAFNGPINTEAQGHPVPYFAGGPMWIGSAVISAGISVEDHSHAALAPISGAGSLGYGGDLFRARTAVQ